MKKILLFAFVILPFMVVSCEKDKEKDDEEIINGTWYKDYKYHTDNPNDIEYYTNGEYMVIDGTSVILHTGDHFDGEPLAFSYKDGMVTIGAFSWKVNKLTKNTLEIQRGTKIQVYKKK